MGLSEPANVLANADEEPTESSFMRDELSPLRIVCLSLCASLYCFAVLWLTDQFLFRVIDGYFLGASYVAPCCTVFFFVPHLSTGVVAGT